MAFQTLSDRSHVSCRTSGLGLDQQRIQADNQLGQNSASRPVLKGSGFSETMFGLL